MVDLHLVSWNRPKMTELVIKAIYQNTAPGSFRLVVLDNGSDENTRLMLQHYKDIGAIDEYVSLATNLGLEAARHLLLRNCTKSERFVCVDNDCLPPPREPEGDWLQRLNSLMDRFPDYKAISCRTQVMIGSGNIFEQADETGEPLVDFPHPGGSLRLMEYKAVMSLGGWDREAPGRGSEEKYICGKLREAGHKTAFATDIRTLHLFGTRGKQGTDRWGYEKSMKPEESGHSDIWHPALDQGDDFEEVSRYTNKLIAAEYFENADHSN